MIRDGLDTLHRSTFWLPAYAGGSDTSSVIPQRGQVRVVRAGSVQRARAGLERDGVLLSASPSRIKRGGRLLSGSLLSSRSH